MTPAQLLELRKQPPRMGRLASAARRRAFGDEAQLREAHPQPEVGRAAITRAGDFIRCDEWPQASLLRAHDEVLVAVEPGEEAQWASYISELASQLTVACTVAPFSRATAGTHRLWLFASARIVLPDFVHVEVRHDLVGIRLAQVALGFGADTLGGPVETDRKLPLAGVTRPNENTRAGLASLIEQVGLTPVEAPR